MMWFYYVNVTERSLRRVPHKQVLIGKSLSGGPNNSPKAFSKGILKAFQGPLKNLWGPLKGLRTPPKNPPKTFLNLKNTLLKDVLELLLDILEMPPEVLDLSWRSGTCPDGARPVLETRKKGSVEGALIQCWPDRQSL